MKHQDLTEELGHGLAIEISEQQRANLPNDLWPDQILCIHGKKPSRSTPGQTLDDMFLLTLCLRVSEWNMLFYNSSKAKSQIQLSTGSGHHLYVQIWLQNISTKMQQHLHREHISHQYRQGGLGIKGWNNLYMHGYTIAGFSWTLLELDICSQMRCMSPLSPETEFQHM